MTIITSILHARVQTSEGLAHAAGRAVRKTRFKQLSDTLPDLHIVEVDAGVARCVTGMLITCSTPFIVEPEPDDMYTIAVKAEVRHVLDDFVKECEACRHPKETP